jgi:hypothetical protein
MAHKIISDMYEFHKEKIAASKKRAVSLRLNIEEVKTHDGIYPNVYFGPMEVAAKKRKLVLKSNVIPIPMYLVPVADYRYTIKMKLFGFIPIPVKMLDALQVEFRNIDNEKYLVFTIMNSVTNPNIRIKTYDIPKKYTTYIGGYRVANMDNSDRVVNDVKINKEKEFYILHYTFLGRHKFHLALRPVDENTARIAGVGQFLGEKIQWEISGEDVKMHWSGLILVKE